MFLWCLSIYKDIIQQTHDTFESIQYLTHFSLEMFRGRSNAEGQTIEAKSFEWCDKCCEDSCLFSLFESWQLALKISLLPLFVQGSVRQREGYGAPYKHFHSVLSSLTFPLTFGTTTIPAHHSVGSLTFEITPKSSIR